MHGFMLEWKTISSCLEIPTHSQKLEGTVLVTKDPDVTYKALHEELNRFDLAPRSCSRPEARGTPTPRCNFTSTEISTFCSYLNLELGAEL